MKSSQQRRWGAIAAGTIALALWAAPAVMASAQAPTKAPSGQSSPAKAGKSEAGKANAKASSPAAKKTPPPAPSPTPTRPPATPVKPPANLPPVTVTVSNSGAVKQGDIGSYSVSAKNLGKNKVDNIEVVLSVQDGVPTQASNKGTIRGSTVRWPVSLDGGKSVTLTAKARLATKPTAGATASAAAGASSAAPAFLATACVLTKSDRPQAVSCATSTTPVANGSKSGNDSSGGSNVLWIVLAIVAAVIIIGLIVFFVLRRRSPADAEGTRSTGSRAALGPLPESGAGAEAAVDPVPAASEVPVPEAPVVDAAVVDAPVVPAPAPGAHAASDAAAVSEAAAEVEESSAEAASEDEDDDTPTTHGGNGGSDSDTPKHGR